MISKRTAYVILFTAAACWLFSGCWEDIASPNQAPVANAGPDQVISVGSTTHLNASGSYDPDGDDINYQWELVAVPANGQASLSSVWGASTELVPDTAGVWVVRVVVSDGELDSEPDVVLVRARKPCETNQECHDDNPCTADLCAERQCVNPTVEDGTECGSRYCSGLDWMMETCMTGECSGSKVTENCDDGNACTIDSCETEDGCTNTNVAAGTDCGVCAVCDINGSCFDDLDQDDDCPLCQECASDGTCVDQPAGSDVKDECATDDCNTGDCDGSGACLYVNVVAGTPCDGGDGDYCNSTCNGAGSCSGPPVDCDDGDICNGTETCNTADGSCQTGTNLDASEYCDGNDLVTCDGAGNQTSSKTCVLGCNTATAPDRCYKLDPSNIDPTWLCAGSYDLVISDPATIDTENGTISGVASANIVFNPEVQGGTAPDIGVFSFNSIDIQADVTVSGGNALALLACNDITIAGEINAKTSGRKGGPGGYDGGLAGLDGDGSCHGEAAVDGSTLCSHYCAAGSGGGGHGGTGGSGGEVACPTVTLAPGAGGGVCGADTLVPLAGGSGGAGGPNVPGADPASSPGDGGGGGGAVQIAAGASLFIALSGGVTVAGDGGGQATDAGGAGGGAGGAVLLEAATIDIGSSAFLAANGGGGGGGDCG